jgi:acyl carrier protein
MNEGKDMIRAFVVENFLFGNEDSLRDQTSFLDEGIIDSTGILELVSFLEETFTITVKDEELIPENLDSIANVVSYLNKKMENNPTLCTENTG